MSAELDRDRNAIVAAKAEAASLTQRLDDLSREIDRERLFLDETSQFAVDTFNRKVSRYNSLLEDVRSQNGRVNQMVDAYNDKLRRYGR
jgi:hypothetical protein